MQYEMRTYLVPEGRMDDILARFRDVTMGLFKKYDMECLGFWTITKPEEDYALVYLMRYESAEAQAKAYEAVDAITFPDGFCRRDIGQREVRRERG